MTEEPAVVEVRADAGIALIERRVCDAHGDVHVHSEWVPWTPSQKVEDAAAGDLDDVSNAPPATPTILPSIDFNHTDLAPAQFQVVASADGHAPQNLVIFLHGRGDSHAPFARLAAQMALPQTAALSLRAPHVLPFDLGFSWVDDMDDDFNVIPPHVPHVKRSHSLDEAAGFLKQVLCTLHDCYAWPFERMYLFGFSQGACAAFHCAMTLPERLGGVVLIAGGLVRGPHVTAYKPTKPPRELPCVMICGGADSVFSSALAMESEAAFCSSNKRDLFARHVIRGKDHGMIASRDEMQHVMAFFSRHLYLRNVELERRSDIIEIR
ncbi:TPA: hypothetical protein N0F65_001091 [Lagenidium giganteum]|uniref:Phospholipase/carboxylesterase/thioesterase domain-containing protein n=1 Tax=Lagenidium giganteum TaxID=4803 RepID=A0AAV2YHV4_9STRA|nr:TPA: hypothetical protein N0F65_011498 [Lagenidium giganteum]DAZ93956.1 TPA: hypothetical protein N0F65_001091 [Lagenidium giganteum]